MIYVDVGNVIDSEIDSIKSAFKNTPEDFTSRAQDAQISQVIIVFSASFDTIKLYLPDDNNEIELEKKVKLTLVLKTIDEYNKLCNKQCIITLILIMDTVAKF